MSAGKVKIINRVLEDLLTFLKEEPAGKHLTCWMMKRCHK
jgi:hypothetical protein